MTPETRRPAECNAADGYTDRGGIGDEVPHRNGLRPQTAGRTQGEGAGGRRWWRSGCSLMYMSRAIARISQVGYRRNAICPRLQTSSTITQLQDFIWGTRGVLKMTRQSCQSRFVTFRFSPGEFFPPKRAHLSNWECTDHVVERPFVLTNNQSGPRCNKSFAQPGSPLHFHLKGHQPCTSGLASTLLQSLRVAWKHCSPCCSLKTLRPRFSLDGQKRGC